VLKLIRLGCARLSGLAFVAAVVPLMMSIDTTAAGEQLRMPPSTRLNVGAGLGNSELAARVGWATDLWLSPHVGVGSHLGALIQGSVARSSIAYLMGPELAVASDGAAPGFWLATLSTGYAVDSVTTTLPCEESTCFFGSTHTWSHGGYASLEVGYLAQGRFFLGGFGLRGEVAGWPGNDWAQREAAITFNLVGGINLR